MSQDNKFRRAEMRWWRISKKEQHTTCSTSSTWPALRQTSLYSDANGHGQVRSKGKLLFRGSNHYFLSLTKIWKSTSKAVLWLNCSWKTKQNKTTTPKQNTRLLKDLINSHNLQHLPSTSVLPSLYMLKSLPKPELMQKPSASSQQDLSQWTL